MAYDVIIIGAGTAGLTAAIYARRANKTVLVFEELAYGGQIINTLDIENYPAMPHVSGVDFAKNLYQQATELGAQIKFEKVEKIKYGKIKTIVTADGTYESKSVIIATGSIERHLGLPHEEELIGRGISYCATCDGAFYRQKTVAVCGGGNTALWDALYLADVAEKVYVIHRRDEFRADVALVDKVHAKANVTFIMNAEVTELLLDEKKKLSGIKYRQHDKVESTSKQSSQTAREDSVRENTERENTQDGKDAAEQTLELNGLFVAVGRVPATQEFADVVALDESGYIQSDESCLTSAEGIFVAGDNRAKTVRQLVTATADGAVAATAAINYLSE